MSSCGSTFSSLATWSTVLAITSPAFVIVPRLQPLRSALLEPVRPRSHDQRLGSVLADTGQLDQLVDRQFAQVVARADPVACQPRRKLHVHTVELQQLLFNLLQAFLARDRFGQ